MSVEASDSRRSETSSPTGAISDVTGASRSGILQRVPDDRPETEGQLPPSFRTRLLAGVAFAVGAVAGGVLWWTDVLDLPTLVLLEVMCLLGVGLALDLGPARAAMAAVVSGIESWQRVVDGWSTRKALLVGVLAFVVLAVLFSVVSG